MASAYRKNAANPVGVIFDHGGINAPKNALICNGAAVSRSEYSKLFAAIGETWGAGNGVSTFNLPDLTNRVTRGAGA
ncbi:MAG: tail fiber protein, partial [Methyloprofundus sp.]|nr:tail fiber protein [Methyloprofundus sp.]